MKKVILTSLFVLLTMIVNAQDLISGGTNSWILHTPDDTRTTMHIVPKINGTWSWANETVFYNNGNVKFNGDIEFNGSFTSDLKFEAGNDWIFHTDDELTDGYFNIAPKNSSGNWDWNNQIRFTRTGGALFDGFVGINSLNPDSELTVKGKIHCEEVQVDLSVPADYVFEKYYEGTSTLKEEYTMPTLEEVEKFTKENHHLPSIPSAKEIQEEGLQLKEMTNLLLQKIEELTLYTIEQEKRIKALEAQVNTKK